MGARPETLTRQRSCSNNTAAPLVRGQSRAVGWPYPNLLVAKECTPPRPPLIRSNGPVHVQLALVAQTWTDLRLYGIHITSAARASFCGSSHCRRLEKHRPLRNLSTARRPRHQGRPKGSTYNFRAFTRGNARDFRLPAKDFETPAATLEHGHLRLSREGQRLWCRTARFELLVDT